MDDHTNDPKRVEKLETMIASLGLELVEVTCDKWEARHQVGDLKQKLELVRSERNAYFEDVERLSRVSGEAHRERDAALARVKELEDEVHVEHLRAMSAEKLVEMEQRVRQDFAKRIEELEVEVDRLRHDRDAWVVSEKAGLERELQDMRAEVARLKAAPLQTKEVDTWRKRAAEAECALAAAAGREDDLTVTIISLKNVRDTLQARVDKAEKEARAVARVVEAANNWRGSNVSGANALKAALENLDAANAANAAKEKTP